MSVNYFGIAGCFVGAVVISFGSASADGDPAGGCTEVAEASVVAGSPSPTALETHAPAISRGLPLPIAWDNGENPTGMIVISQLDVVYPFQSGTADDFLLRDQNPIAPGPIAITHVEWGGGFW